MKKKSIKLAVDEPCHEDWNAMTPQEKGRYCGVCSKVVVDFTSMSDRDVLNLLDATKSGETCGQFTASQLGRAFHYPVQETSSFNLRAVLLGATLTSVLGLESCKPEKHVVGKLGITQTTINHSEDTLRQLDTRSGKNHFGEKYITGMLKSEDGKAVSNGTVALFSVDGKLIEAVSTSEGGLFKLDLDWSKSPDHILVSGPDYSPNSYQISNLERLIAVTFVVRKEDLRIRGNMRIIE